MRLNHILGTALLATALLMPVVSCVSSQHRTDAEQARIEANDATAAAARAEEARQLAAAIAAQAQADAASTPEHAAAAQAAADAATAAAAAAAAEADRADSASADIDASVAQRVTGTYVDILDKILPVPLQPFRGWITGLAGVLLFKRPRRRVKNAGAKLVDATKKTMTGEWGEAGAQVGDVLADGLRLVGLKHSSEDPIVVGAAAAKLATKAGNDALATDLQAVLDKHAA
tara:strand:- start:58726 stop:59418 length:693 start_codon:yes stop_codon:yes gene_type:complete